MSGKSTFCKSGVTSYCLFSRFGFGRKAEAAVHCQLTILSDGIPVFAAGVDWEPVAFEGLVDILHLDRLHRRLCKLLYKIPVNQTPER